jgi:hypothetical protein
VTDSFREEYAHVWATIYHVELLPQDGGAPIVLFDDASGRQIDLKTLRDADGARYSFLGSATVPAGTYTGVNVSIGDTLELIKTGATTGDTLSVDSSLTKDASGHPIVGVTFRKPKTVGMDATNVIVDFDLARFIVRSTGVIPVCQEGDGTGLNNPKRHDADEYRGRVADLTGTAPNLNFTLNRGNGQTITVTTTASTAIYGGGTLANGSVVDVSGTLDTTTQNIVATQIEVRGAGAPGHEAEGHRTPRVVGSASAVDATAGTFTLTLNRARGFKVGVTTVNVVTGSETTYRDDNGATVAAADFFASLASTPDVVVEGTYDASSNTLTATSVRAFNPENDGGWEHDAHPFRGNGGLARWGNGTLHH